MRVLFLSHTGHCAGAEVAMLRLIDELQGSVETAVACPREGPLAERVTGRGVALLPIPGTAVNSRLDLRHTAPALASLAASAAAFGRAARRFAPDVVHANTLRAGLIAALPRRLGGPPLLVQSHEHLEPGPVSRATREVVSRSADHVIAVTEWTARNFNAGLARPLAERVYIGIDHARFRPPAASREEILARLPFPVEGPLLGQVAQITPWKGQDVSIRAFARVRERFPAARLLLIGSISFQGTRYDNQRYLAELERLVAELRLEESVHFLGQRDDVPELMSALDMHLLPSWDEPFGTASAEAMAMGTVPFVTEVGGMPEYVEDGVCGRVLPPRDPEAWAAAAIELLGEPQRHAQMRRRARHVAAQFTLETYARNVHGAWEKAIRRAGAIPPHRTLRPEATSDALSRPQAPAR